VKTFRTGCFCIALSLAWVPAGWSQDDQPQTPPEQQAGQQGPIVEQPPPPPPKRPDIRMPGETGWFAGAGAWFPTQQPIFDKGRASYFANPSRLDFQGKPNLAEGAEFGFAVGAHNSIHVSYFQTQASGDFTTPNDITVLNQTYSAGTLVSTNYRLQNLKISFDYLTWPFPVESRRFRLRTLWQVQYLNMKTGFDAPLLPLFDANGNPITDSSGNAVNYAAAHSYWFVLPSLGLGATEYVSRNVRIEAEASGFTIPHHTTIWDADASANFRMGKVELGVGGRAFHFKTSTQQDFYSRATLFAPFVRLRWYSE
jgi:hypothetical protein